MAQSDDSREFGQDVWGAVGALNDAAIGFLDESARLAGHTSAGRAILAADIGYSVIFAGGDAAIGGDPLETIFTTTASVGAGIVGGIVIAALIPATVAVTTTAVAVGVGSALIGWNSGDSILIRQRRESVPPSPYGQTRPCRSTRCSTPRHPAWQSAPAAVLLRCGSGALSSAARPIL